jgi:hypothetical protein
MDEPTREQVKKFHAYVMEETGNGKDATPSEAMAIVICESWLRLEAVLLLIASCGKVEVNAFRDGLELNLADVTSIALSEKHAETVATVLGDSHG